MLDLHDKDMKIKVYCKTCENRKIAEYDIPVSLSEVYTDTKKDHQSHRRIVCL